MVWLGVTITLFFLSKSKSYYTFKGIGVVACLVHFHLEFVCVLVIRKERKLSSILIFYESARVNECTESSVIEKLKIPNELLL